jgi:hypothetical protein
MKRQLLPLLLVLSGSSTALAAPAQIEDIQEPAGPAVLVPVVTPAPCDEPAAPCDLRLQTPRLTSPLPFVPQVRVPWQLRISLSVQSGVVAAGVLLSADMGPAAYLGGDVRFLWSKPGKRWGLGLRLSGSKSLGMTGKGSDSSADASGFEAGFLFDVYNFWISAGLGFSHYGMGGQSLYLPEASVALGYDIPLGNHFALRLAASLSTLMITARAQLGGGLVVRF